MFVSSVISSSWLIDEKFFINDLLVHGLEEKGKKIIFKKLKVFKQYKKKDY